MTEYMRLLHDVQDAERNVMLSQNQSGAIKRMAQAELERCKRALNREEEKCRQS